MTFLRSIVSDLVEKRLWPIAVALVIGVIAVPLVLGGGGDGTPVPAPPASATAATNAPGDGAAQVSLATATATGPRSRKGAVHNPFKTPPEAKSATTGLAAATSPAPGTAAAAPAATSTPMGSSTPSSGSAPSTSTPTTTTTTKTVTVPRLASRRTYRVAVRFGESGDERTLHDALRLTALPSTAKPAVLLLGVLVDGKTAVFIVNSSVQATGDGWCRPRPNSCHILQMQAGDSEMLELATGTAGIVQYRLHVAKVVRRTAKTRAAAAHSHARVSKAGRELLRAAIANDVPGTGDFRFDRVTGLLLPR